MDCREVHLKYIDCIRSRTQVTCSPPEPVTDPTSPVANKLRDAIRRLEQALVDDSDSKPVSDYLRQTFSYIECVLGLIRVGPNIEHPVCSPTVPILGEDSPEADKFRVVIGKFKREFASDVELQQVFSYIECVLNLVGVTCTIPECIIDPNGPEMVKLRDALSKTHRAITERVKLGPVNDKLGHQITVAQMDVRLQHAKNAVKLGDSKLIGEAADSIDWRKLPIAASV